MTRLHRATTRILASVVLTVTAGAALIADPAHAGGNSVANPSGAATYTVVSGDYLGGIAVKLSVRLADLLATNHLTTSSLIYPGMRLLVPPGGRLPATTAPAPAPALLKYTVVSGDYLGGIASKLGVTLSSLLSTNKLTASSLIHPGMQLTVPTGGHLPKAAPAPAPAAPAALKYTVVSGDYLGGIASKLGVTLSSLLSVNKLIPSSLIYPGLQLTVPAGGHLPAPVANGGSGSPATSDRVSTVLNFVRAQLGEPYKFNAAGPDEWDCSGLTMVAYAQIGISLPHYSGAQAMKGTAVDWTTEAIKPGDLVFLESYPGSGVINHVGIATSATQWIQAPRTGDVVRTGTIPMYRVISVRRFVQGG